MSDHDEEDTGKKGQKVAEENKYKFKKGIDFPLHIMMKHIQNKTWKIDFKQVPNSDEFLFQLPQCDVYTGEPVDYLDFSVYKSDLKEKVKRVKKDLKDITDLIYLLGE